MYTPNTVQRDRARTVRLDLVMSGAIPPIQTLKVVQSYLTGLGADAYPATTPPVHLVESLNGFYIAGWTNPKHHVAAYLSLVDEFVPDAKLGWQHPYKASLIKGRTLMRSVLRQLCT